MTNYDRYTKNWKNIKNESVCFLKKLLEDVRGKKKEAYRHACDLLF